MLGNRKTLAALFLLLGGGFVMLLVGINDLKHPEITTRQCDYLGRGKFIESWREQADLRFKGMGRPEHDIALQCPDFGMVMINEEVNLPIKDEEPVQFALRQYQFLPDRYRVKLPVENPDDLDALEESSKETF